MKDGAYPGVELAESAWWRLVGRKSPEIVMGPAISTRWGCRDVQRRFARAERASLSLMDWRLIIDRCKTANSKLIALA